MPDQNFEEISDEKIELLLRQEKEYYQNDFKEAMETILAQHKIDKERVENLAKKFYTEEEIEASMKKKDIDYDDD